MSLDLPTYRFLYKKANVLTFVALGSYCEAGTVTIDMDKLKDLKGSHTIVLEKPTQFQQDAVDALLESEVVMAGGKIIKFKDATRTIVEENFPNWQTEQINFPGVSDSMNKPLYYLIEDDTPLDRNIIIQYINDKKTSMEQRMDSAIETLNSLKEDMETSNTTTDEKEMAVNNSIQAYRDLMNDLAKKPYPKLISSYNLDFNVDKSQKALNNEQNYYNQNKSIVKFIKYITDEIRKLVGLKVNLEKLDFQDEESLMKLNQLSDRDIESAKRGQERMDKEKKSVEKVLSAYQLAPVFRKRTGIIDSFDVAYYYTNVDHKKTEVVPKITDKGDHDSIIMKPTANILDVGFTQIKGSNDSTGIKHIKMRKDQALNQCVHDVIRITQACGKVIKCKVVFHLYAALPDVSGAQMVKSTGYNNCIIHADNIKPEVFDSWTKNNYNDSTEDPTPEAKETFLNILGIMIGKMCRVPFGTAAEVTAGVGALMKTLMMLLTLQQFNLINSRTNQKRLVCGEGGTGKTTIMIKKIWKLLRETNGKILLASLCSQREYYGTAKSYFDSMLRKVFGSTYANRIEVMIPDSSEIPKAFVERVEKFLISQTESYHIFIDEVCDTMLPGLQKIVDIPSESSSYCWFLLRPQLLYNSEYIETFVGSNPGFEKVTLKTILRSAANTQKFIYFMMKEVCTRPPISDIGKVNVAGKKPTIYQFPHGCEHRGCPINQEIVDWILNEALLDLEKEHVSPKNILVLCANTTAYSTRNLNNFKLLLCKDPDTVDPDDTDDIKLSTPSHYRGLEQQVVVYLTIHEHDPQHILEGWTRCTDQLVVICPTRSHPQYKGFFAAFTEEVETARADGLCTIKAPTLPKELQRCSTLTK